MTDAPSVSEDLGDDRRAYSYDAPLDLATTLSRPRQYVKAVLRLLVQRWDPFLPPQEDEKTGDLRFAKVALEEANARLLQVVVWLSKIVHSGIAARAASIPAPRRCGFDTAARFSALVRGPVAMPICRDQYCCPDGFCRDFLAMRELAVANARHVS
jgi:hypothetical protein